MDVGTKEIFVYLAHHALQIACQIVCRFEKRDGSFASSQPYVYVSHVMPYSGNSPSLTSRVFDPREL